MKLGTFNNFHHFAVDYVAAAFFNSDIVKAVEWAAVNVEKMEKVERELLKKYMGVENSQGSLDIYEIQSLPVKEISVEVVADKNRMFNTVNMLSLANLISKTMKKFETKNLEDLQININCKTRDKYEDYSIRELMHFECTGCLPKRQVEWRQIC